MILEIVLSIISVLFVIMLISHFVFYSKNPWYFVRITKHTYRPSGKYITYLISLRTLLGNIALWLEPDSSGLLKEVHHQLWRQTVFLDVASLQARVLFSRNMQERKEALSMLYFQGNRGVQALEELANSSVLPQPLREIATEYLIKLNFKSQDADMEASGVLSEKNGNDTTNEISVHANITVQNSGGDMENNSNNKSGDSFEVSQSQVGSMGSGSPKQVNKFTQQNQQEENIDTATLAEQLGVLREALKAEADTPEQDLEVAAIALAEIEARKGNANVALKSLKSVTSWTLGVAEKIGVALTVAYIKQELGL